MYDQEQHINIDNVSSICYFYYPKVAYWVIVSVASTVISLISYLSFRAIWCKVNPFNQWMYKSNNFSEEEIEKKTINSVLKFYRTMFTITLLLLCLSIICSTILSELCFDSASNVFEEQYIAAILVLVSYVMVSLSLTLLWSAVHTELCKSVVWVFIISVLIHFGFIAVVFYWMQIGQAAEPLQIYLNSKNASISLMVGISILIHSILWLFITKIFKFKFFNCCESHKLLSEKSVNIEGTETSNSLTVDLV